MQSFRLALALSFATAARLRRERTSSFGPIADRSR
jgi:hypothetical protein